MLGWSLLPFVSSCSPAEVLSKVDVIYLQERIKVNLSLLFFLCILTGVRALSQPREGCREVGRCLRLPSTRAVKGEGAVPPPAAPLLRAQGEPEVRVAFAPGSSSPSPPAPTPSSPGSLPFV